MLVLEGQVVCVCVRACVRACVCVCVYTHMYVYISEKYINVNIFINNINYRNIYKYRREYI